MTSVRKHDTFRKTAALLLALALALPLFPALAAPMEQPLRISVQWVDALGTPMTAAAAPLMYQGYENAFWLNVPADALGALTLQIEDVSGVYATTTPASGTQLTNVFDAGNGLTESIPVMISCFDVNNSIVATYSLYISTTTVYPDQPQIAPKQMRLTVHYVDEQYTPIANDDVYTLDEGANQPITAAPQNLPPDYYLQGDSVQYVTVDQNSPDTGDIYFVYTYVAPAPRQMRLTVHYVDEQYTPIANDDVYTLDEGANQPITADPQNLPPDYHLQGDSVQYVTVDQNSPDTSDLYFVYTYIAPAPKQMRLTVHYVDEQYTPIANDDVYTLNEGASQPITANPQNLPPDYYLQGDSVQYVTVDQNSPDASDIYFIYTYVAPVPRTIQVIVHYVDESYVSVAENDIMTFSEGTDIPVAADPQNLPADYHLTGQPVQYITIDQDTPDPYDVFFIYQYVEPIIVPRKMTLTIHYVNADRVPVALDSVIELSEGNDIPVYADPQDLLPNYTLDGSGVQYVTVDQSSGETGEITFYYSYVPPAPKTITLTIHYVDSTFTPVADDGTMTLGIGEDQAVIANPENLLPDYELASDDTQLISVYENSPDTYEIYFIYDYVAPAPQPKTMSLTIHYVNFDMISVAPDQVRTLNEGVDLPIAASPEGLLPNYVLTGDSVRYITVDSSSPLTDEIFFYYEYQEPTIPAVMMTLTVHYVDTENQPVASDDVFTLSEGENIPISAAPRDLLEGYELFGEAVQYVTVSQSSAPAHEIAFRYQKRIVTQEPIATETPPPAPKVALITIQYQTLDGQTLYVETAVPCFEGQANVIRYDAAKIGYGYILKDNAEKTVYVDGNGVATPGEVIFYVSEPDEVFINIYYRSLDGLDVASAQTELCAIGNNSFMANPMDLLPGYQLTGEESQNVYLDEAGNLSASEIVFWYQPMVTPTPTLTPTPVPYTVEEMDTYCYPKNDGMNFRSSPSSQIDTNIIRTLKKSELAHIVGLIVNDANEDWYFVDIEGTRGFLKGNFVRLLSEAEIAALFGTPIVTPTATATIAVTPVPENAPIDFWGTINDKAVGFRRMPQTGDNLITRLSKNTRVWVYQSVTAEDGEKWYFTNVNGKQGYIMAEFVTLMTAEENSAYQASLPSPMPTQTPIPTPTPTAEPTDPPPVVTTTPDIVETSTVTPTTTPEIYHGYALTKAQTVLRTGVSLTDDTILALLPERTLVNISAQTYVEGVCWDSADVIGINMRGFIEDSALRHINNEEALYYLNNLASAVPTASPTITPAQYDGYAITQGDNVPMRAFPDTNAKIEEVLQIGSVVMVHGQEYIDGTPWHVVQYGSMWGYIRGDQIRMLSEWEVTGYLESLKTPTPTPTVTQTPAVSENNLSSYGYVDTNRVNLRSAASKSSTKIRLLDEYAFALVLGTEDNEEGTWYHVSQAGTEGYIMSDYFTVLTLGELTEFLQSDNYLNSSSEATISSGSQIQAVEDYNQTVWKNPSLSASYEPFNPYATPTTNPEAIITPTLTPTPTPTLTPYNTFVPIGGVTTPVPTAPTSSFPYGLVLLAVVLIGGSGAVYAYTIHRRNERRRQAVRAQQSRQASAAGQQPYMRTAHMNHPSQQTRAYPAAPYMPPMGGAPRAAQPPQSPQATSQYQPVMRNTEIPRQPNAMHSAPQQITASMATVRRTPEAMMQNTNPYRRANAQAPDMQATRHYTQRPAGNPPAAPVEQATSVYLQVRPTENAQNTSAPAEQPVRRRRSDRHQQGDDNA